MFYSHEILTSRKYGVATVWLVATLGAKSNAKRVTRKAILSVDVQKACETIVQPEAPMALRLQSNLLFGVSKVYDQQCLYVLQDVQAANSAIRALQKTSGPDYTDLGAGKARPEQLMIMDDPAFLPDDALPALEFDFDNLEVHNGDTQRSTQSMMSIRQRSGSVSSHAPSFHGLEIPSSSGRGSYQLPDPFGGDYSSAHKEFGGPGRDLDEEDLVFDSDQVIAFGEDGDLLDIAEAGIIRPDGQHPRSSAASNRVRKEHEDGRAGALIVGEDDYNPRFGDDDMGIVLNDDAEPFDNGVPFMTGGLGGDDRPQHHGSQDRVLSVSSEDESSVSSVRAQQKKKAGRPKKVNVVFDNTLQITNRDLRAWNTEYVERMRTNNQHKLTYKISAQAIKNAYHFVLGSGIQGVGEGIGTSKLPGPLAIFSGASLLQMLSGVQAEPAQGTKRSAEDADLPAPSPKRIRESEQGRGNSPSQPNNNKLEDDLGFIVVDDEHSVELGRDAGSILPEAPSSALMPWNVSASVHSHKLAASGSQAGRAGLLSSQNRNRTSASPLVGRGSHLPAGEMDNFSLLQEEDVPVFGRDEEHFGSHGLGFGGGHSSSPGFASQRVSQHADEFELFGQAANVDTQTAGQSQWVRDALDKESNNFLAYVKNTIQEKSHAAEDIELGDFVTFEELFETEGNTAVVAAQAFYHVLCLATKRKVWVEQDGEGEDIDGEIRIGVTETESIVES